jgi:predicted transposase YbfD/YdcC
MPVDCVKEVVQEAFSRIEDRRCPSEKVTKIKLVDVLITVMCGVLCGLQKYEEIEEYGKQKFRFLHEYFGVERTPSDSTISRIMSMIDGDKVAQAIIEIMQAQILDMGEILAVDGKTMRGTSKKDEPHSALQILTAYLVESGIVLGQEAIREKTNEIPVFQEMLDRMDVKGKIITADAMHCQRKTCKKIIEGGGDYVFGLKGNQETLLNEVQLFFKDKINADAIVSYAAPLEKNGGRLEKRTIAVCYDAGWLSAMDEWVGLKTVVAVKRIVTDQSGTTEETSYYISSLERTPEELLKIIRKHWGIESMHWLLDVVLGEDDSRIVSENGNKSFNAFRKLALSLHRQFINKLSKKTKPTTSVDMLHCLLSSNFLVTVLSQSLK